MSATTPAPRSLVRLLSAAIAAALLAIGGVAIAAPASAHDALVATDPAADSTVDALPAQLTLTFSDAIDPTEGASEVQVTDAAGNSLVNGSPVAQDNVLTQPLAPEFARVAGEIRVLWKVVSSDGHPTSGEFSFTVAAPAPTPTPTPTPTETAEPTPTETPTATPSAPPADEDSTFSDAWPWVIGGLLVAGLGGAVLYLLISRARRQRDVEALRAGSTPPAGGEPPADR